LTTEPAGPNCAAGGERVDVGLDANGNDVLDDGEISQTAYICDGASPVVDAGPTCPVGCCAATATNTTLADSVVGFSDTQSKCGWSYGYLSSGAEPFTLLSVFTGASWEEASTRPPFTVIFVDRQHSDVVHWSDRRWTSTFAGTISIQGHLAKSDPSSGDGTIGRIRVDGNEIWSADIAFNDVAGVDFALNAPVQIGSIVDFILDPKSNIAADTTTFKAVIKR